METLDQIKQQIAENHKFDNWTSLMNCLVANNEVDQIESHWNLAAVKYADQFRNRRIAIIGSHVGSIPRIAAILNNDELSWPITKEEVKEQGIKNFPIKPIDLSTMHLGEFVVQDFEQKGSKYHK